MVLIVQGNFLAALFELGVCYLIFIKFTDPLKNQAGKMSF
jgi:hypothetical protein